MDALIGWLKIYVSRFFIYDFYNCFRLALLDLLLLQRPHVTGSERELSFTGLVPRRHACMHGGASVVVGWDQHQQRAVSSTTAARIIYADQGYTLD